jgi:hypothetical protein
MIISAVLLSAMLRGSAVPRMPVLPPSRCFWVFVPPSNFLCLRPRPPIIHRRPTISELEVAVAGDRLSGVEVLRIPLFRPWSIRLAIGLLETCDSFLGRSSWPLRDPRSARSGRCAAAADRREAAIRVAGVSGLGSSQELPVGFGLLRQDLQARRVYSNPEFVTLGALASDNGTDSGLKGHDNLLQLAAGRADRGHPRHVHTRNSTPPASRTVRS